ncbi:MAG: thioredoxin family protein [Alistipes sp.]|nr:thioredoxin family protein [Alistipes senegalensis]MCM1250905.1 thioredoxin family protein [Alistipes sp.]
MKSVKLFYLRNCPFCKRALQYIDDTKAAHPELAPVDVEMIEESEDPEVAESFDYYYVPTFYVDGVKVHEGGIMPDEVEAVLRKALE